MHSLRIENTRNGRLNCDIFHWNFRWVFDAKIVPCASICRFGVRRWFAASQCKTRKLIYVAYVFEIAKYFATFIQIAFTKLQSHVYAWVPINCSCSCSTHFCLTVKTHRKYTCVPNPTHGNGFLKTTTALALEFIRRNRNMTHDVVETHTCTCTTTIVVR